MCFLLLFSFYFYFQHVVALIRQIFINYKYDGFIWMGKDKKTSQKKIMYCRRERMHLSAKWASFIDIFFYKWVHVLLIPKIVQKNNIRISLKISRDSMAAERIVYCVSVSYLLRVSVDVYLSLIFFSFHLRFFICQRVNLLEKFL